MSDNYTILIPDSPDYVPSEAAQREAVALFKLLAPDADEVKAETSESVRFLDCGQNFERILCPDCANETDTAWWWDRLGEESESGFRLRPIEMPCCGKRRSLNELIYQWPQGFARFSLTAMNANIGDLPEDKKNEFEKILGCRLKKILQHL